MKLDSIIMKQVKHSASHAFKDIIKIKWDKLNVYCALQILIIISFNKKNVRNVLRDLIII